MLELTSSSRDPHGWSDPSRWWPMLTAATEHLPAPVATLSHEALASNAMDMLVRAGGVPIRVASKSIRVRAVLDAVLALPGYAGLLAYSLDEALWLAQTHDDIVLGYPSVDRRALAQLVADDTCAARITLMIDDVGHLDLIDSVRSPQGRPNIRVAIDADASWNAPGLGHIGVRRSPVFSAADAASLARAVVGRPGFDLVGLMMYEAQIAGQGDRTGSGDGVIRWMQKRSGEELRARRRAIVDAVSTVAPLEFVNGGGTGSLEYTSADLAVTEVTAGSGFFGGHLFDGYRSFLPAPAAAIAFDVVRKPRADIATLLGGGWIASGPPTASRQPLPVWPEGLAFEPREGAGEVQTPVRGSNARSLAIGDRVWMRHAKSGEASERTAQYQLVHDGAVIDELPTYRGEGKAFL